MGKRKEDRKPYKAKKLVLPKWCVFTPKCDVDSCIIALPGRGGSGFHLGGLYNTVGLPNTAIVGVTPTRYEWYPMPKGPNDQYSSVISQPWSALTIKELVLTVQKTYGIPTSRIAFVGYSAGAVMAIYTAASMSEKSSVAAVVSHAGALLDTDGFPQCQVNTEFLLIHANDDESFEWLERYLPMRYTLTENGYSVHTIEKKHGGHGLYISDVIRGAKFIATKFGYSEDVLKKLQ